MRLKFVGNKADKAVVVIKNANTSIEIKPGAPVFFDCDAASPNQGLSVLSPDGLPNAEQGFFAGFNLTPSPSGATLLVGDTGESLVYGIYDYARVLLSTRAASTDVWASYSAVALGDIMSFVSTSGVQAVQRSAAGSATCLGWWVQAAQTLVSQTTQASSVANGVGNSTAMVTQLRVMVRVL